MREDACVQQTPELEQEWDDFTRSLARKGRSAATIAIYRKSFDSFWGWAETEGVTDPADVTHRTINSWTDWMLTQPARRGGRIQYDVDPETGARTERKVSTNTLRIRWQNLRPFFSWWAEETERPNPFDRADTPAIDEQPTPVVSIDDVRALLHACNGKTFINRRDTALVRFLYDTGARVGEVAAMTLDSWDRRADVVTLAGKTGTRHVPISPSTGEALARYTRERKTHPRARLAAFWLGPKGALTEGGVAQVLYRLCDRADIPRIHPHQLRHTWAHQMKTADASTDDLMALGGWKSPQMVTRYGKSAQIARAHDRARNIALGDQL